MLGFSAQNVTTHRNNVRTWQIMWKQSMSSTRVLSVLSVTSILPQGRPIACTTVGCTHITDFDLCRHIELCIHWRCPCSDEMKEAIKQRMVKQYDGTWGCSECDFVTKYQATLTNHVEAKHLQSDGYSCQYCNKFCPTKNALKCHIYQRHSQKNKSY